MKQTIIGVTIRVDTTGELRSDVQYAHIRNEYGETIRKAGAQPIFFSPSTDPEVAVQLCDGLVISGGDDIDPSFYGEKPHPTAKLEMRGRTEWELGLIEACDKKGIPILGVCYGMQLLNVYYGGTLYQDIADQYGSTLFHGSSYDQATHTVSFSDAFMGYAAGEKIASAARHHQAIKEVADGFTVAARADDGVVEAIQGHGHYGVQWHAESDATAGRVYGAFITRCQARLGDVVKV